MDSENAPIPGEQTNTPPPPAQVEDKETEVVDIDEQELRDAQAEAEAEKADADDAETEPAEAGAQSPQGQQPAQPPQGEQQPMIPKARVDEIIAQRDKHSQEAAYWRGVAEATKYHQPQPQAGQPAQPQQPTAEQRLAAIQAQQDELAAKFDNGELTMQDLKRQERALASHEHAIREEMRAAKAPPPQQQNQPQAEVDLFLDSLTARLEQEHPWVDVLDKVGSKADWDYVKARAMETLQSKGINPHDGKRGTYELRREMAEYVDQIGASLLTDRARARGIPVPGSQTPAAQQSGARTMSPEAAARAKKLDLASRAPPNLSSMNGNTGDNVSGVPSEARLEAMSDDEIGALPDSLRRKLLGVT
jgi:hypothetical protein